MDRIVTTTNRTHRHLWHRHYIYGVLGGAVADPLWHRHYIYGVLGGAVADPLWHRHYIYGVLGGAVADHLWHRHYIYGVLGGAVANHTRGHVTVIFCSFLLFLCYDSKSQEFVSDLWQVGGFLWVLWFPATIKLRSTI
jgi:hypothetical protein